MDFLLFAEQMKIRLRDHCRRYVGQLCLLVLVANLADLDFLPELLFHKDYHRGFSPSLLAAILVPLVLTWIWKIADSFSLKRCRLFCRLWLSSSGARIEVNDEYIGDAPCSAH